MPSFDRAGWWCDPGYAGWPIRSSTYARIQLVIAVIDVNSGRSVAARELAITFGFSVAIKPIIGGSKRGAGISTHRRDTGINKARVFLIYAERRQNEKVIGVVSRCYCRARSNTNS